MIIQFSYHISGGYPRLPGMERKDLTAKNAEGIYIYIYLYIYICIFIYIYICMY
jgi:hypothetical protein